MAKLLLVDDDRNLSNELANWLIKHAHHSIDQAFDGTDAKNFLASFEYALIVLDWEMPDITGVELLKSYRAQGGKTPVLMLTGRSATTDKLTGLDTGADDYLTKPFEAEELSARVRALLRRSIGDADEAGLLRFAKVVMDPQTRRVEVDNEAVKFQPAEFDLLYFLATHPNTIFDADRLIKGAWPDSDRSSDGSLRVSVSRIRKKIRDDDDKPLIENLQGFGYRFNGK